MKIDMNNYEAFFLDFVEGRLDNFSTLELLSFLRHHPDLKEELESYCNVRLEPSEIVFEEKEILKKYDINGHLIDSRNFDDYCISYYEKLLSQKEEKSLFLYLSQNPQKQADFNLYGKTFLKADSSIIYENKSFLKKKPKTAVKTILLRWTSVAAGIVLAISIFYRSPEKISPITSKNNVVINTDNADDSYQIPESKENSEPLAPKIKPKKQSYSFNLSVQNNREEIDLSYLQPISVYSLDANSSNERPELKFSSSSETIANNDNNDLELFDYAGKVIKDKVFKKPDSKLTLWNLAELTLKGYNHLSEKDIILHRQTDENGKLTAIAIETENGKYGFETKN